VFFPSGTISRGAFAHADKDAIGLQEALIEIYRKLRPAIPPTLETATNLFRGMFFRSAQVRFQPRRPPEIQHQDGLDTPLDNRTWIRRTSCRDQVSLQAAQNIGVVDDIDHLGNARSRGRRTARKQFRIGLVRMEAPSRKR